MPSDKTAQRRALARKKKQRRAKVRGRILLMTYVLLFLGVLAAASYFVITQFFQVEEVRVVGESRYSAEEITASAAVPENANLIFYNTAALQDKLLQTYPYIQSVKVSRRLPGTLVIDVTGQEAVSCVQYNDRYIYAAQDDKILEISQLPLAGKICFTGFVLPVPIVGESLNFENDTASTVYHATLTELTALNCTQVVSVNAADLYAVTMNYGDRITMKLGSAQELAFKISFGIKILENENGSGIGPEERGTLDLSLAKENNKAYFTAE